MAVNAGRNIRKPGVSSRNPVAKYKALYEIDCDENFRYHVMERISNGFLMLRKSIVAEDTRTRPGNFHRELMLVRNFDHRNVVYYEDGYSRSSRRRGHQDEAAMYTPLSKYGTLRHLGFRLALDNRRPPESFVWHVLTEMAAALVYIHLGHSTNEDAESYDWFPHHQHKPTMHGNIDLGNMLVGTNENWTFADDTDEESRLNPRIRLANFHTAEQWPRWASLVTDTTMSRDQKQAWHRAETYDIRRLLRSITFFCGGRAIGTTAENDWGTGIQLPDGYSPQLQSLLGAGIPGLPIHLRSIENARELTWTVLAYKAQLALQPEPIPIEYLGPLHTLASLTRENSVTDLLYQTFVIDDNQNTSRPGPEPLVWDGLIREDADHFDELGAPLPFIAKTPDNPEWYASLKHWSVPEVHLAVQSGQLTPYCPICYEEWFKGGMEVITNPCRGQHVYCVSCLKAWLGEHGSCPQCRENMRVIHGYQVFPIRADLYSGPSNALFQPEIPSKSDDTDMPDAGEENSETPPEEPQAPSSYSVYSLHEQQELLRRGHQFQIN